MQIPADVLTVLHSTHADGSHLTIPGPRLDASLYQRVNEVLEAVGGRWVSNLGVHVFPGDAAESIAPVLATGSVTTLREKRQQAQYFPTPAPVVARLLQLAGIQPGMRVLEPSAGSGAIAGQAVAQGAVVDCIERDPGYAVALENAGIFRSVRVADFLAVPPEPVYDRVVMNPPFTRGADIQHVRHAMRFLAPGGLLTAVMSHATAVNGGPAADFRLLVERHGGAVEAVPDGAFRTSGTDVRTILVTIPATAFPAAAPIVWPADEKPAQSEDVEFADPAELARQIVADLRAATAAFEEVAASLGRPFQPSTPDTAPVPTPQAPKRLEQLSLIDLEDAA